MNNCLYEYYTDGSWRRKACSRRVELAPRARGGLRTTARRVADTGQETSWRNHVAVDVIGEEDTQGWPYNQAQVDRRVNGDDV